MSHYANLSSYISGLKSIDNLSTKQKINAINYWSTDDAESYREVMHDELCDLNTSDYVTLISFEDMPHSAKSIADKLALRAFETCAFQKVLDKCIEQLRESDPKCLLITELNNDKNWFKVAV